MDVITKIIMTAFVRCLANGVLCDLTVLRAEKIQDINEGKFRTSYVYKLSIQPPPLCYGNSNECPVHITLVILYSQRLQLKVTHTTVSPEEVKQKT